MCLNAKQRERKTIHIEKERREVEFPGEVVVMLKTIVEAILIS